MPRLTNVNGPSLLDKMWDTLDGATHDIMSGNALAAGKLDTQKGFARGVAECIMILSTPVFHSTDAVVSCAVSRYGTDATFSGSPAIIHHAPPNGIISSEELAAAAPPPNPEPGTDAAPILVPQQPVDAPAATSPVDLTEGQRDGILAALGSGLTAGSVAAAFGVEQYIVEMLREQP